MNSKRVAWMLLGALLALLCMTMVGTVAAAPREAWGQDAPLSEPTLAVGDTIPIANSGEVIREVLPNWMATVIVMVSFGLMACTTYALYVVQRGQWHMANSYPADHPHQLTLLLKQATETIFTTLDKMAERTPTVLDDLLLDALRPMTEGNANELVKATDSGEVG